MNIKKLFCNDKPTCYYRLVVFLICFFGSAIVFLPFVIKGNGVLSLCLDFDAQEIPFNIFVNREIKSRNVFFNWSTDIGSALIPSFSFYNIGSPFFWITLLFKPETFPYLVSFIFPLKYAVAGLTAYLWLERQVSLKLTAVIGGVLYAFSGFQAMNIVFYHFHDAVAFFPLLLLGLDLLIQKNEWRLYVLSVFLNASTNWVFFVGEAVFLVFYYCLRYGFFNRIRNGNMVELMSEILKCFGYAMLGAGCAAMILIPSVYTMLGSSRIGEHLSLRESLLFSLKDYLLIVRGMLFPSEPMNRMSAITHLNWYSVSAYLPMISVVPAFCFFTNDKQENYKWIRRFLLILIILAGIPILNSIFSAFNREPYRRWYYMLSLILILASLLEIEKILESESIRVRGKLIRTSIFFVGLMVAFAVLLLLAPVGRQEDGNIGAVFLPVTFAVFFGLGIAGVICFCLMLQKTHSSSLLILFMLIGVLLFGQANLLMNIVKYRKTSEWKSTQEVISNVVNSSDGLDADIIPFRWAVCNGDYPFSPYYNINMAGSLTSRNSFISTLDNGIFEFYDAIDYHRHTGSPFGPEGTNELLSVKSYLTAGDNEYTSDMRDTDTFFNGSREVTVFEDERALPIGFTYDSYITDSEFRTVFRDDRSKAMLRTLVIPDQYEEEVSEILQHYDLNGSNGFSTEQMNDDIYSHLLESSVSFEHSSTMFKSIITADKDKYAFFSVPYSPPWRAYVNGIRTPVIDSNGLMAVRINKGSNNILFKYDLSMYYIAAMITAFSWVIFLISVIKKKWRALK